MKRTLFAAWILAACASDRIVSMQVPVYDRDVLPIFTARCSPCHAGTTPAGGWSYQSFRDVVTCALPSPDAGAPVAGAAQIPVALNQPDHQGLLTAAQRSIVNAWLHGGTPLRLPTMHDNGIMDPASPSFHATVLRNQRWAPMLDATRQDACGLCHAGAPARPTGLTASAAGAPPCTDCHSQPGSVLDCSTCHGQGSNDYPPRDPCFYPNDPAITSTLHAPHVNGSAIRQGGLPCTACHPSVTTAELANGPHGDGIVHVVFDPVLAGPDASYDPTTRTCTVACHAQGGRNPAPTWVGNLPSVTCNDCHLSPPANHYTGPCNECHGDVNATGDAVLPGPFHINGTVDLGDGSGTCWACHGSSGNPSPSDGSHPTHQAPPNAAPVTCDACHTVPSTVLSPGHIDNPTGHAQVHFGSLASVRSAMPVYTLDGHCQSVACHGAGLPDNTNATPLWGDTSGTASVCGACHGIPPPPPHPAATTCESVICHGSEVMPTPAGPQITPSGQTLHINGVINVAGAGS